MSARRDPRHSLQVFLDRAYDVRAVSEIIAERWLHPRQRIGVITPLRGHVTKDNRVIVSHRAEITDDRPGSPTVLPLFLHHTAQSRLDQCARYRRLRLSEGNGLVPDLKRRVLRLDRDCFLSAFPLDPELKQIGQILRPRRALQLFNDELRGQDTPPAEVMTLSLLGYRPERRAVFRARTVAADGAVTFHLIKIYRRQAAKRLWQQSRLIVQSLRPVLHQVAWPSASGATGSVLRFPFIEGATLDELIDRGLATAKHFETAGELLRELHRSPERLAARDRERLEKSLRPFRMSDEVSILARWGRIFKRGGHPLRGQIARCVQMITELDDEVAGPFTLTHRDFYQKQVIVPPHGGRPVLIDMDTVSLGPAAIDVGNFLAHLEVHRFRGVPERTLKRWRRAFVRGYGCDSLPERAVALFEFTSLVRLVCLAAVSPEAEQRVDPLLRRCRKLSKSLVA
jgi:hypothetical protein